MYHFCNGLPGIISEASQEGQESWTVLLDLYIWVRFPAVDKDMMGAYGSETQPNHAIKLRNKRSETQTTRLYVLPMTERGPNSPQCVSYKLENESCPKAEIIPSQATS
jgi:hypothetical protein